MNTPQTPAEYAESLLKAGKYRPMEILYELHAKYNMDWPDSLAVLRKVLSTPLRQA